MNIHYSKLKIIKLVQNKLSEKDSGKKPTKNPISQAIQVFIQHLCEKSKLEFTHYLPVFASCFAFLAAFFFFRDGIMN